VCVICDLDTADLIDKKDLIRVAFVQSEPDEKSDDTATFGLLGQVCCNKAAVPPCNLRHRHPLFCLAVPIVTIEMRNGNRTGYLESAVRIVTKSSWLKGKSNIGKRR
jgi:hypothetical protein